MPFKVFELRELSRVSEEKTKHNPELSSMNDGRLSKIKLAIAKDANCEPELYVFYTINTLNTLPDDNLIGGTNADPLFEEWKKWLETIPIPTKAQRLIGFFKKLITE